VRDLADLHVRAMTSAAAAGERFLAVGDLLWMEDMARELRSRLGERARKVPTRRMPDVVVRILARFDPSLRAVVPAPGRTPPHRADKAEQALGWRARPGTATVVDCATSLLDRELLG